MSRLSCILLILSQERNETQCKCVISKTKLFDKYFESLLASSIFATFNRNNEPHHEKTYKNKVANLISVIVSLYIYSTIRSFNHVDIVVVQLGLCTCALTTLTTGFLITLPFFFMVANLCHFVFLPRNNATQNYEITPREKTK